jgi:perosamine synthetase
VNSIPYARQDISDDDVRAVQAALLEPMLTQGPGVAEFERRLAETVGVRYAVSFNSGTAALHAAYFAAGVGPGRSVLTSPITFVATTNASLYLGGGVHFADIDQDTVLLDPASVDEVTASDVAVVTPVHFGGQVADLETLAATAARRGWLVVEDAAHALGATYTTRDGQTHRVGSCAHSALCCFSFHPVKHITTGEGGAVTTNDEGLMRKLRAFRSHGITRDPSELERPEGPWYYEQHALGFNYRLTDFQCALGLSQLSRLGDFVERRRRVAARYDQAFARSPARPLRVPRWSRGSYHLYVVRVPASERRRIFESLRAAEIGVNVHYIPVYHQPYYRRHGFRGAFLTHAESYYAEAITLPMFPGLTDGDIERVVREVNQACRQQGLVRETS